MKKFWKALLICEGESKLRYIIQFCIRSSKIWKNYSPWSISLRATASLWSSSLAAYRRQILEYFLYIWRRASFGSVVFSSSFWYFCLNSIHFSGSWENHFRSFVLGAISLSQISNCARSLDIPLGQRRSTRTR